jgi:hypothetical protein
VSEDRKPEAPSLDPKKNKPPELSPHDQLKELYRIQQAIKVDHEAKRVEMRNGAAQSRQESMSAAAKKMKEVAAARDNAKAKAKREYDQSYSEAEASYNQKVEALKKAFEEKVQELDRSLKGEYEHARSVMQVAAQPIERKAFEDSAQIDRDLIDEVAKIDATEAEHMQKVNKVIDKLERELHVGKYSVKKAVLKEAEKLVVSDEVHAVVKPAEKVNAPA